MKQVETCTHCGGFGFVGHDCGEDSCCCLYPEENTTCSVCLGAGTLESTFDPDDEIDAAINYELTKELNEDSK